MRHLVLSLILAAALMLCGCGNNICGDNYAYDPISGMIHFDEPARAEGQQSMLGYAAEPMDVVRVGFVGLGMRGRDAVGRFTHIEGVEIRALCDLVQENVDVCSNILEGRGWPSAEGYVGEEAYKGLCHRDDIDLVYISTDWASHVPIALYAMEHGKHVAVEVPAATTIAECWQLVDTSERTRRHCMMLENCVYDFFELTTLNMAQQGLFGDILHAEGAYIHNLAEYWGAYHDNWRLEFNRTHRGDVYATHGFGPICMALDIHRGNRLEYLVSMDTKSANGAEIAREMMGATEFANGDHTTTMIKTSRGQSIMLQHNVFTPRPYNRLYQLTGTRGFANKYPIEGFTFAEGMLPEELIPEGVYIDLHGFVPEAVEKAIMEAYKHPIHRDIEDVARRVGGHGGMDYVMDYRLVYCLRNGLPLDQDVYDAAEWSSIGELTATSAKHNSMPVAIPDFTRGEWNKLSGTRFHTR